MNAAVLLIFVLDVAWKIANVDGAGTANFQVDVHAGGSYAILVNNATWLNSGDTAFTASNRTYSTADQSLKLTNATVSHGSDSFGPWTSHSFIYQLGQRHVNATIQTYNNPDLPAAIFRQTYLSDAVNTSTSSSDNVISKFPSFLLGGHRDVDLGYLAFAGNMAGYSSMSRGRFVQTANFPTGIKGGPLVIFDNSSNVIVISPRSAFMAASSSIDPQRQVNWGIMGHVNHVPRGYSSEYIVYFSNRGINQAIQGWGKYLTTLYQKSRAPRDNDLTIQYLGYWTDNGAYYYYNTEKGKNYEDTIIDTVDYIDTLGVPFKYIQYDSWWYPKGSSGGVNTWTARKDIFPHGFKYISDKIKLPLACHNRYWDSGTAYAKYNGGQYNFVRDGHYSVPDDAKFWIDLFNETQTWGDFILYEQDWLDVETDNNAILKSDLTAGQRWLQQMGDGASKFGPIYIQYCMSYGRHILQALEIPAVTQARVSGDYHPGNHQWSIGITSILVDALNLAPFKDTFYTSERQPGDPYNGTEPNTRLQALISTLSTGPVGPGDGIGYINKTLLMRCCDSNGLILKPAKPATAIDDEIKRAAFKSPYPGPDGNVYTTHTSISGFFFGIVLGTNLNNNYSLTPANAWPTVQFPASLAFSASHPHTLLNFSSNHPIRFGRQCTTRSFCLYYTSPILQLDDGEQFVIHGELGKWVPMSHQRFNSIQVTGDDFLVQLMVQAKETVTFSYHNLSKGQAKSVVCDNSKGTAPALSTLISLAKGTCTVS
ncbi:hypothetical protein BsWGS_07220 [Bradybaena similaris]